MRIPVFGVSDEGTYKNGAVQPQKIARGLGSRGIVLSVMRLYFYTPRKLCLWEGILFSRCPSERPTDRPNVCP